MKRHSANIDENHEVPEGAQEGTSHRQQPTLERRIQRRKELSSQVSKIDPVAVDARAAAMMFSVSRASWLALRASGRTPKPFRLGRRVLWNVLELNEWASAGCPALDKWEATRNRSP
jgi:predicted DNA-binding transcriptional regulator AlpA